MTAIEFSIFCSSLRHWYVLDYLLEFKKRQDEELLKTREVRSKLNS